MEAVADAFRRERGLFRIAVCILQLGAVRTLLWGESIDEGDGWFDSLPEAACRSCARVCITLRRTRVEKSGRGAPTKAPAER